MSIDYQRVTATKWANYLEISQFWPANKKLGLEPLPREWAHYRALYLSGKRAVLQYTVGDREVIESPWLETLAGHPVFTRTFEFGPSKESTSIALHTPNDPIVAMVRGDGGDFQAGGSLDIPAWEKSQFVKVYLAPVTHGDMKLAFEQEMAASGIANPRQWMTGGPTRWSGEIVTEGELGNDAREAYVMDTLTLPYENPWNALMYPSGHDFFANGDAAVCMAHGDVWVCRGIDAALGQLCWKRLATGLSSPLGLKIVNEVIYVTCHDQITRLHDLNGDDEADVYENFNNACQVTDSHHRFATDLETDAAGNFYYKKCTDEGNSDHGGSVIRVSADGKEFNLVATGLRNPNGMGIGPNDLITFGNQQGGWVPSSAIHVVKEGAFYVYMPSHHREVAPAEFEKPLCWIPHGIENSCGGQRWAPSDDSRWGPLAGSLLHFSYGQCRMFVVPHQVVDGVYQGAVVSLPNVHFKSSAMRARFRPADGQLYVCGLRGWQTSAELSGAFHRVRYIGKPLYLTTGFAVEKEGIRLHFSQAVDVDFATNLSNYQLHQWNYRWTQHYGSKDYSVVNPEKEGRDVVEVTGVKVSDDKLSVLLHIPNIKPGMQLQIQAELRASDEQPLPVELYGTVNVIP